MYSFNEIGKSSIIVWKAEVDGHSFYWYCVKRDLCIRNVVDFISGTPGRLNILSNRWQYDTYGSPLLTFYVPCSGEEYVEENSYLQKRNVGCGTIMESVR